MSEGRLFPENFLWGVSTSAYQVEGSPLADGAGMNIWHRFSHTPGSTASGETGDVACDHYRRYADDVAIMRGLGLNTYRFSIAWSRVLPNGTGKANPGGLAFYDRLIDSLLAAGMAPNATLYHWDLPAALDDRGGWLNRDIADWFAEYATLMVRTFGDRVAMWATLNEPWVVSDGGYLTGALAPGHRSLFEAPIVAHNLLRAHGAGVLAARAAGATRVGLVVNLEPKDPASEHPDDVAATRRADAYMNLQYLDPALLGHYPAELQEIFGEAWPEFPANDFTLIRQPIDWLGINYYTRGVMKYDALRPPIFASHVRQPQHAITETGWEVHAPSFTRVLIDVLARYGRIPTYITENGAAFYDPPRPINGRVDDPLRVEYLRTHLLAVREAMDAGVDIRGYYAWSFLDNFEWSLGFAKRFGLVHVDYSTQQRTLKSSAHFYREIVRSGGASLHNPHPYVAHA